MRITTKVKLVIVNNEKELEKTINNFCANKNVKYVQIVDNKKAMVMYEIISE